MEQIKGIKLSPRHFLVAVLCSFGLLFLLALLRQPVVDWDEKVYLYLSEHMTWWLTDYTTRGSFIDDALPQGVYSAPVFHHPPLVPYLIKLLSFRGAEAGAKLLNFGLYLASLFLVFSLARRFSDLRGATLALALWALCPVLNLEARLVHLDLPCTVLLLAGTRLYLESGVRRRARLWLGLSGLAFAAAMLTKYTAPLFAAVPALLFLSDRVRRRDPGAWAVFGGTTALGFAWWIYILLRFGSLAPAAFVSGGSTETLTPYLRALAQREWTDVWLYFTAICPLFVVYVAGIGRRVVRLAAAPGTFRDMPDGPRGFLALNVGALLAVLVFSLLNAHIGGTWTLRHIMPLFPIVYIGIGRFLTKAFDREHRVLNAALLALLLLTVLVMSASTFATTFNERNLKPAPISLFWLGLEDLFH